MRRRFFVDGFDDGFGVLRGDAANHLGRVLRAEPGQMYELSDGNAAWLARTEKVTRDEVRFVLVERLPAHLSPVRIALLLAIVKFDRFEWSIEKATELGVDEILPLTAERSEKGLISAAAKRAARWERILMESAQQARRLSIPVLHETANPREAFRASTAQIRMLLSERPGARPMRHLLDPAAAIVDANRPIQTAIAIGPEGGWTDAELSVATASGFSEAALGSNILRTETAVCAALAAVQYAFGLFRPGDAPEYPQAELRGEKS